MILRRGVGCSFFVSVTIAGLSVRMVSRSWIAQFTVVPVLLLILSVTKDYSYIVYDDFWSLGLRGVSVFDLLFIWGP